MMKNFLIVVAVALLSSCWRDASRELFPVKTERVWISPDVWANPLQDWKVENGKVLCVFSGKNRNVTLLTRTVDIPSEGLDISFDMEFLNKEAVSRKNWAGLRLGVQGEFEDYRSPAVFGKGFNIGLTTDGRLFAGGDTVEVDNAGNLQDEIYELEVEVEENSDKLTVELKKKKKDEELGGLTVHLPDINVLAGSISFVSSFPDVKGKRLKESVSFSDIDMEGKGLAYFPDRAFGPVLFTLYTVSNGILKLTAQFPPIGKDDGDYAGLQFNDNGKWKTVDKAKIEPLSRTAVFTVENINAGQNIEYRIKYKYFSNGNKKEYSYYNGIIRREPELEKELVMAAFTGNLDVGFPNNDIVRNIQYVDPDILFFSGDQIYEWVGGYGVMRIRDGDITRATLDYLRKWYMFGWAYGGLLSNRPAIVIPDDHDVFQSNLWGAGGKAARRDTDYVSQQTCGGYLMPPDWVNMVQRTQTSNLPAPGNTKPVEQGIQVYYTSLNYGGVSFAVLEDRKFKSGPQSLLPEAKIWNGWPQNKAFDVKNKSDVPGATLLGERQLDFLDKWAQDWPDDVVMKAVLSQTIFANVATLPKDAMSDAVVPKLKILQEGDYPPDDEPVTDFDSNGWPKTGRDKAVHELRKAFAVHIAGDQHLGSLIQYGERHWHDGSYAFCVPSIANAWPRRWFPQEPGLHRKPGMPLYTGDFIDGFGNLISVYAVSNPYVTGKKPSRLYDRASGFGIIRFNKINREITFECWPRQEDLSKPGAKQYKGWPVTISQFDNNNQSAGYFLPLIKVNGAINPVVRLRDENGEILFTVKIKNSGFQPKVYKKAHFTVEVRKNNNDSWHTFKNIVSQKGGNSEVLNINLK